MKSRLECLYWTAQVSYIIDTHGMQPINGGIQYARPPLDV